MSEVIVPLSAMDWLVQAACRNSGDPDLFFREEESSWQDLARCAEVDPETFFPEKGGSTREAKKVCRGCEVRASCLEYALENGERFGIWGGMSERERRRIEHARGLPAVA